MSNKVEELKKQKGGLEVWPDLLRYSKTGFHSIPEDDLQRFRWYGIYQQKPREDGCFMMRVKIPGGDVSAEQMRVMGEVARDYCHGFADFTTRQNVQYHWLTIETIPEVLEKLNSVGLTTVGACGDIARNIVGCPVAGLDPSEIYDCRSLVHEVTRFFLGNKDFADLPRKFKMSISGCAFDCAQPEINDIGITAVRRPIPAGSKSAHSGEEIAFQVRVGGGLSTQPYFAQKLDMIVHPSQVLDVCRAITEIFRDDGYRDRRNRARMKFLVADIGPEEFKRRVVERLGWTPEPGTEPDDPPNGYRDHLGILSQKQHGLHWIGVVLLNGRVTAQKMLDAAVIASRFCDGNLRTTNQQNLIFPNIAGDDLEAAKSAIRRSGFEWEASPFRKAAVACTGNEFCNLAITETKLRLVEIIEFLEKELVWDEDIRINLNGCPNSCGQHHIGDIGLQGCLAKVGEQRVEAYDICLGGRLGSDARFSRPIERKVPADKVKYALVNLLLAYRSQRYAKEDFSHFVERHSDDELGAMLGRELLAETDPEFVPPPPLHAGE
ncbi:MAG: nitrite/sulfite reductase [Armatimonadetes bacterium]|nr:nitrite/sulfite reductase [Armatimonadota bacterium]